MCAFILVNGCWEHMGFCPIPLVCSMSITLQGGPAPPWGSPNRVKCGAVWIGRDTICFTLLLLPLTLPSVSPSLLQAVDSGTHSKVSRDGSLPTTLQGQCIYEDKYKCRPLASPNAMRIYEPSPFLQLNAIQGKMLRMGATWKCKHLNKIKQNKNDWVTQQVI